MEINTILYVDTIDLSQIMYVKNGIVIDKYLACMSKLRNHGLQA